MVDQVIAGCKNLVSTYIGNVKKNMLPPNDSDKCPGFCHSFPSSASKISLFVLANDQTNTLTDTTV